MCVCGYVCVCVACGMGMFVCAYVCVCACLMGVFACADVQWVGVWQAQMQVRSPCSCANLTEICEIQHPCSVAEWV